MAGFYLAWGTPWLVGAWWRARHRAGAFDERRAGALLALGGGAGCVALVAFAGYDPALIDAVPGARSNTTPPTLYTAVAAIAQVGLLIVGARVLDRAGRRWRRLWDRAGEAAVGVYAWHLTALALCAALISAGLPAPERLTTLWWVTRPAWWGAVLALTGGFVALTAVARTRLGRGPDRPPASDRPTIVNALGVLASAAAGAAVGLRGPRSILLATSCSALFVISWLCFRSQRRASPSR